MDIRDTKVVKFYRFIFKNHFYYGKISSIHKCRGLPSLVYPTLVVTKSWPVVSSIFFPAPVFWLFWNLWAFLTYMDILKIYCILSHLKNQQGFLKTIKYLVIVQNFLIVSCFFFFFYIVIESGSSKVHKLDPNKVHTLQLLGMSLKVSL